MKKFYYIFCVVFAALLGKVIAQPFDNNITGIVLDKKTGESLPNVNIYISNTTWGTTSNIDGSFKIFSILPANHEIVFSMIGYESQSKICKLSDSSKIFIKIEMVPKVYEIKEVTVTADRPEQWFDDLEVFRDEFLGYFPYSYDCKIVNEYNINFLHPLEKTLVAESDYPVEVINYTLGYDIKCEIRKFEYDQSPQALRYSYRLFFAELDTNDLDVKAEWERNRQNRYKESLPFFLRTLFEENFQEKGFEVSLIYKPGNPGVEILKSSELIIKDILTETYKLNFADFLQVYNYNNNLEKLRTSWIRLDHQSVTIDKYGFPLENRAITIYGYWSELGVASFLPKYYGFTK